MKLRHIKAPWAAALLILAPAIVCAQQSTPASAPSAAPASQVLRAESRVVRVDVIVTDKKGNYIHDLTARDFHVFDNNQEEPIVNFCLGSASGVYRPTDRQYMVLFLDA